MCVQRFDDSLNSAIHITYRISLRSSSMPEPRDPLLKVLTYYIILRQHFNIRFWGPLAGACQREPAAGRAPAACQSNKGMFTRVGTLPSRDEFGNDPSAGSPTETLLRLLLPLNDQV